MSGQGGARPLTTDDMFLLSEAFDAMDLTLDVKGKTQEEVGADFLLQIARRLHRAKEPVKALLASLTGKTPEQVGRMAPRDTVALVADLIKQDGVLDFFKSAVQ